MQNNRNYFVAIALSVLILIAWQFLYVNPKIEADRIAQEARQAQQAETVKNAAGDSAGTVNVSPGGSAAVPGAAETRDLAVAQSARIAIDTPAVSGSINLTGARFDDLKLKEYRETVDPQSPVITLFSPAETEQGYFAELGYVGNDTSGAVPGPQTVWTQSAGTTLTPTTPVTLSFTNEKGVVFERTISIDDHFMFTVTDSVRNGSAAPVSLASYGRVTRFTKPTTPSAYVLHEGFIGVLGETGLHEVKYKEAEDKATISPGKATSGWLGITDKYWAAALVPPQATAYDTRFAHFTDGRPRYQADYKNDAVTVAAGQSTEVKNLVFAGAKVVPLIESYETSYSIPKFDLMIDWGWFYFFTKPMFKLMDYFFRFFGNFGIAILLTTIVVKLLFFPLANKQYKSMANMKKVQPKMAEMKEKYGDDKMGLQQAMMQLYKEEKINPLAGCWPILLQIPVFFALYKVIYVTIEMRHAPFFGWIRDLSAPDPTSLFNLFGLLPYDVPHFLMIGVWPIIMGITMFLQMRMNPTPPDPTQAMLFTWMPVVFTFMLATFPAGLVIYWAWNNTLSVAQQAVIMKRNGVKIELFDNMKGLFSRKPKPAE
ncbi:membrane protein insertase YidC [Rhizobium sp. CFBP 8762]|uniref:membrane protein insertase YidC n=1 Tax=Rhizobium sp. CFBP 8762 TaxID=2775279 RepID=UPI0017803163|nr:membrane protein insertase YidC [Rhizobium sp. CFBP 8762]MBD8553646.1 membrane protein insertase YidC [Rhizobium sp. CFBP 8762]